MTDPNRLLIKLRTFANNNIRDILISQPESLISPIPKKYLPAESYLRELYNQAYYCHYANMDYASLSLSCICLEKICKDIYKQFLGKLPKKTYGWRDVIKDLNDYFKKNKDIDLNKSFLDFLYLVDNLRKKTRNFLLHGDIDSFIADTNLIHNTIDVFTKQKTKIEIEYNEYIHSKRKGKIMHQKIQLISHDTLILLSAAIIKFYQYIDLSKLNL